MVSAIKNIYKGLKNKLLTKASVILMIGFLLVQSGFSQNLDHWEMVVEAKDTWHYFPGVSEPPADWADINFDTSSWQTGIGGFGYGDNDDGTIISPAPSVYIRINFNLIDTSSISWAILNVDYDDAFVAYLNGHEIARANIGTTGIRPTYSTYAIDYREAQMYSGGKPAQFIIHNDTLTKYLKEGNNVLALQVHNYNSTSSDLSSAAYLSLGITDTSTNYRETPIWFDNPLLVKSNLPLIFIETMGQSIPDDPKITSWLKVINNGPGQMNSYFDEATDYNSYIGIEARGQSSQLFPKKSFSIETRNELGEGVNVSLLGMPAEEDWILHAPYSDKTMLRNAITFELGSQFEEWQPRYKYCEVYINGNYQGVYLLLEKIKRDINRVDINKLYPYEISGDDVSGGYIVKVDKTWDLNSNEYFYTYPSNHYYNARNYAFTYVYPDFDEIVTQQKSYLYNYLVSLENSLNGSSFQDPVNGFRKYIDVNSFVDFQIMNELSNNVDGYRYSTFFYKKKDSDGGKLFAGPLWDFNLGYGNVDYSPINLSTEEWLYPNYGPYEQFPMHWWARLMEDPGYKDALYSRWTELRAGPFSTDSIMDNLTEMVQYMGPAIDRNYDKWPIIGQYVWPNYDWENTSYQQEVDYLKSWLSDRLNWMDANISSTVGIVDSKNYKTNLVIYPNPVKDQVNIRLIVENTNSIDIEIMDLLGKKVFYSNYTPVSAGNVSIELSIPTMTSGYYILLIKQTGQVIGTHKLLINN